MSNSASKPVFSIIVPARNMERFINETLQSVRAQTMPDFEVICVNDKSTDGTGRIMEDLAQEDGRFKVVLGQGRGVSAARNQGLKLASGHYILFLDADDLLKREALSNYCTALDGSGAVAAVAGIERIDEEGQPLPGNDNRALFPQSDHLKALLRKNAIVNGGAIAIRKNAVAASGGYDETLKNAEDWEFWCRLALLGDFEIVTGPPLLSYRQVSTGANYRTRGSRFAVNVPCLDKVSDNSLMRERFGISLDKHLRARRIDIFWSGVRNEYHYGSKVRALLTGIVGIALYPDSFFRPKLILRFAKSLSPRHAS